MPLAEANQQSQPGLLANNQAQPDHPSWMPLAEANQQSQPGHPSRMPLAEANKNTSRLFILNAISRS